MPAVLADLLTGGRIILGIAAAAALATHRVHLFNILLTTAWASDVFDGRLARRADRRTIFSGEADMIVDTWVGACVIVGFAISDRVSVGVAAAGILVLGAAYLATRNPAISQVLQGTAYGASLWLIYTSDETTLALPLGILAVLLVLEREKFFGKVLPMFFRGVVAIVRRERYHGPEHLKTPRQ